MKKIYLCLGIILSLSFLCNICFADGGGPSFAGYRALISNEDGADYYDDWPGSNAKISGTLPYHTKIEVLEQYEINSVDYAAILISDEKTEDWYSQVKYVKQDDVIYDKDFMSEDSYRISDNSEYLYCFEPEGTPVRELAIGESDVVGTIPFGKTFIAKRVFSVKDVESFGEGEETLWWYISYSNIKGFISSYSTKLGTVDENSTRTFAYKDQPLYKYADEKSEELITIPKDTRLYVYGKVYNYSSVYYVYYKGKYGFVFDTTTNKSEDYVEVCTKGAKIYEEPDNDSQVLFDDVPVGVVLKADWKTWGQYERVEYNGYYGWIKCASSYEKNNLNDKYYVESNINSIYVGASEDGYSSLEQRYLARFKEQPKEPEEINEQDISGENAQLIDPNNAFNPEEKNVQEIINNSNTENEDLEIIIEQETEKAVQKVKEEYLRVVIIAVSCVIILLISMIVTIVLFNKKMKERDLNK